LYLIRLHSFFDKNVHILKNKFEGGVILHIVVWLTGKNIMDDVVQRYIIWLLLSKAWAVLKLLERWNCSLKSCLELGNESTFCVRGFSEQLTETVEDN
jgi:hypothetical protein